MSYSEDLLVYNPILDTYLTKKLDYENDQTQIKFDDLKAYYDGTMVPGWVSIQVSFGAATTKYNDDDALRKAIIAEWDAYNLELPDYKNRSIDTFYAALDAQRIGGITFQVAWPGPWGYAGILNTWLHGNDLVLPVNLTDPHLWIRNRLIKANLSTTEWDNHVTTVQHLAFLRANPPSDIPEAPELPIPPVAPPNLPAPPPPPPTSTPDWKVTPTTIAQAPGYVPVTTSTPLLSGWNKASPGQLVEFSPGTYKRPVPNFKPVAARPANSPKAIFQGSPGTIIPNDPTVGGTANMSFGAGTGDCEFRDFRLELDDYGIFCTKGVGKNMSFIRVHRIGKGNPLDPNWKNHTKWGGRYYDTGNWLMDGCITEGVYQEHNEYFDCIAGDHIFRNCITKWCGRTRLQVVNRKPPDGTNPGFGNIIIEDDYVEDVCLEDGGGGSAYTFRGGMWNTVITLRRCKVRLGCNPDLAFPFNKNITGSFLCDIGQYAFIGSDPTLGQKEVHLYGCDFEVGTIWPGVSNARRANLNIGNLELLTIKDCRFVSAPKSLNGGKTYNGIIYPLAPNPVVLDIQNSVKKVLIMGNNEIIGRIRYRGVEYMTLNDLKAAHPALFV